MKVLWVSWRAAGKEAPEDIEWVALNALGKDVANNKTQEASQRLGWHWVRLHPSLVARPEICDLQEKAAGGLGQRFERDLVTAF